MYLITEAFAISKSVNVGSKRFPSEISYSNTLDNGLFN